MPGTGISPTEGCRRGMALFCAATPGGHPFGSRLPSGEGWLRPSLRARGCRHCIHAGFEMAMAGMF